MQTCDVTLPPKILLDLRTQSRDEIVEVHDDVDAHVEEHEEGRMATSDKLEEGPADHGHYGVMNYVQRCQLVIFLSQNKEERIHEIDEFGKEIPPNNISCTEI